MFCLSLVCHTLDGSIFSFPVDWFGIAPDQNKAVSRHERNMNSVQQISLQYFQQLFLNIKLM